MKGEGYNWTNPITPYIHVMVYHLPQILKTFGSVKIFTGQGRLSINNDYYMAVANSSHVFLFGFQGVEKKNDDMRKSFHQSINRWDACKSLLLIDKRQEVLQSNTREKRPYNKTDASFWHDGGKSDVSKKYKRISWPNEITLPTENTEEMDENSLSSGVSTQVAGYTHMSLSKLTRSRLREVLKDITGGAVNVKTRKEILIDSILTAQTKH